MMGLRQRWSWKCDQYPKCSNTLNVPTSISGADYSSHCISWAGLPCVMRYQRWHYTRSWQVKWPGENCNDLPDDLLAVSKVNIYWIFLFFEIWSFTRLKMKSLWPNTLVLFVMRVRICQRLNNSLKFLVRCCHVSGVQTQIQKLAEWAIYVHCYAHRINLVIVDSQFDMHLTSLHCFNNFMYSCRGVMFIRSGSRFKGQRMQMNLV
jgi:hypothetical protein